MSGYHNNNRERAFSRQSVVKQERYGFQVPTRMVPYVIFPPAPTSFLTPLLCAPTNGKMPN